MFAINLQRFAEPLPVDPAGGNGGEPNPFPNPSPRSGVMPSGMAPEAWKNVEDMLVTLSSNIRIQFAAQDDKINKLISTVESALGMIQSGTEELNKLMGEFKDLLEAATVEVPEEEHKKNEQQKEDKNKPKGYLDRR